MDGYNILIAEDSSVQAKKLKFYLKKFGHTVTWAENGIEGLECLEKDSFDLIISDYQMPGMDGIEFLKKVRGHDEFSLIPFMILTTIEEDDVCYQCLKNGANDYLIKPFRPEELRLRTTNLIMLYKFQQLTLEENNNLSQELIEKNKILEIKYQELERAHGDMKEMQQKLLEASKSKSLNVMGAGVAHEINNPLAIISGYTSQLESYIQRSDVEKDKVLKINEKIQKSADRIKKIVSHLKEISSCNLNEEERRNLDLNEIVMNVQSLFSEYINENNIKLKIQCHHNKTLIKGKRIHLEHVLINLIQNSLDAFRPGDSNEIYIKVEEKEGQAILTIKDNGTGIKIENIDNVFDPFFTTKAPGEGTGLGLSLSRSYVEDSGGIIDCLCQDGYTIFRLIFKLDQGDNND